MKVLVVEDDVACRDLLSELLRRNSYEVVTASNGREALDILSYTDCRMVISDWMMPEVNGPTLCRAIRSREGADYTFIILLTARDSFEDMVEGLSAGADEFITKPFHQGEVWARTRAGERVLALRSGDRLFRPDGHAEQIATRAATSPCAPSSRRFAYRARQWAAPCTPGPNPDIGDFIPVECRDLDRNGVSFQSIDPFETGNLVVSVGDGNCRLFLLSEITDRETAINLQGSLVHVLHCRFLHRIHLNLRDWGRSFDLRVAWHDSATQPG